jgi:hypothetical protein
MTGRLSRPSRGIPAHDQRRHHAARLVIVLVLSLAAGVFFIAIVILEYLRVRVVLDALKLFRPGITVVGAQLRAGGPLQ